MKEVIRLVKNIQWESIDKDNMEFKATISCYQKDALEEMLWRIIDLYE